MLDAKHRVYAPGGAVNNLLIRVTGRDCSNGAVPWSLQMGMPDVATHRQIRNENTKIPNQVRLAELHNSLFT